MAGQMASFVFVAFLAGTAFASQPLVIQEDGSRSEPMLSAEESSEALRGLLQDSPTYPPPPYPPPPYPPPPSPFPPAVPTANVTDDNPLGSTSDTAQNVVSRSTLTLPDSDNKEAAAQAFIDDMGNNGVIEKRKIENGMSTLTASYELAEAMLIDALSGASLSTAGRVQFTADADNNINVELTLFYPEDILSADEIEEDANAGISRLEQEQAAGAYAEAFEKAGQEAGFDGREVTMSDFDVVQVNTNKASDLKAGLWGLCVSVGAILLLA